MDVDESKGRQLTKIDKTECALLKTVLGMGTTTNKWNKKIYISSQDGVLDITAHEDLVERSGEAKGNYQ